MRPLPHLSLALRLLTSLAIIGAVTFNLTPTRTAHANNFDVTRFDDPAPNGCAVADCSLREAILDANVNAGPDTITLPAGTFILTRAGNDDTGQLGDLDITGDLTLTGAGAASSLITTTITDRLFHVISATVMISGTTISGGNETHGAGLYNVGGNLTLTRVTFAGNNAGGLGGGVNIESGSLTVTESVFTGNTGGAGAGGLFINSGTFNVSESTFTGNNADTGGGLYTADNATGTVSASTFSANTGNSAGLHNSGTLTVSDSLLSGNVVNASAGGGGMGNSFGTLTVINTTIQDNTAGFGGGISNWTGTVIITGSLLSGNTGGAIQSNSVSTATVLITNTTISGNTVNGGLNNTTSAAHLNNVTVTGNSVSLGNGGGLSNSGSGLLTLHNSIVAGNSAPSGSAPDCVGILTSLGHNLIGNADGCAFSSTTGDLIGSGANVIDPNFGPLQQNGGSTWTHALREGSPALEAGDNATCASTDQRGQPRPLGVGGSPVCDMGAFERGVADLALSVLDTPDPVTAGNPVTYTIAITNTGPNLASGVTLTDTLPGSAAFNSATPSQGSCAAPVSGVLTCTLGVLASGASAAVTLTVTPNTPTTLNNTATLSANESDVDPSDNSDSETTTVTAPADPALSMSDAPDPALVGAPLTYTLNVLNGTLPQSNTRVTDTLPVNVTFGSVSATAGTCGGTNIVVCNLGNLNPNVMVTITISVTPTAAGPLTNTAILTTNEDTQTGNNTATAFTTVNTSADLSITISDSADPADSSLPYTYTLVVTNVGPSPANNVSVTDTLPFGVILNSATATQGTCSGTAPIVCSLGTLARGESATITLEVFAPNFVGTINNTAIVTSSDPDPDPSNNTDTESTTVLPAVDLVVTQSHSPDPMPDPASPLTYTIVVANHAPLLDANNVTLSDTLPIGVAFVSATPSQGSCNTPSGGAFTCALGTLGAGNSATVTLVVTPPVRGIYANTASVSGDEFDPNTLNNTATEVSLVGYLLFMPLLRR